MRNPQWLPKPLGPPPPISANAPRIWHSGGDPKCIVVFLDGAEDVFLVSNKDGAATCVLWSWIKSYICPVTVNCWRAAKRYTYPNQQLILDAGVPLPSHLINSSLLLCSAWHSDTTYFLQDQTPQHIFNQQRSCLPEYLIVLLFQELFSLANTPLRRNDILLNILDPGEIRILVLLSVAFNLQRFVPRTTILSCRLTFHFHSSSSHLFQQQPIIRSRGSGPFKCGSS